VHTNAKPLDSLVVDLDARARVPGLAHRRLAARDRPSGRWATSVTLSVAAGCTLPSIRRTRPACSTPS
jgi:hypothetical protein